MSCAALIISTSSLANIAAARFSSPKKRFESPERWHEGVSGSAFIVLNFGGKQHRHGADMRSFRPQSFFFKSDAFPVFAFCFAS